jgi:arsenate reductase
LRCAFYSQNTLEITTYLNTLLTPLGDEVKRILFVCVENAGRSQMAEAFANYYGKGKLDVSSAGNRPADQVNPMVVKIMKEKGIDISMNKPKLLNSKIVQDADLIVTMGYNDQGICPGLSLSLQLIGSWQA